MKFQAVAIANQPSRTMALLDREQDLQLSIATKIGEWSYMVEDCDGVVDTFQDYNSVLRHWRSKFGEQ